MTDTTNELRAALQLAKNSLVAFKFMPGPNNAWEEHDEANLAAVNAALAAAQQPAPWAPEQPAIRYPNGLPEHKYCAASAPEQPKVSFSDPRVQAVYALLCDESAAPLGEHWEGFKARQIIDALFAPEQPRAGVEAREKRWPFVESPGDFAERLREAWLHFGVHSFLPAVRHVLIENPPTLTAPPSVPVVLTDERIVKHAAFHLGEMHVENCGLSDIKAFARAIEREVLATSAAAGGEVPAFPSHIAVWAKMAEMDRNWNGFGSTPHHAARVAVDAVKALLTTTPEGKQ